MQATFRESYWLVLGAVGGWRHKGKDSLSKQSASGCHFGRLCQNMDREKKSYTLRLIFSGRCALFHMFQPITWQLCKKTWLQAAISSRNVESLKPLDEQAPWMHSSDVMKSNEKHRMKMIGNNQKNAVLKIISDR